MITKFEVRLDNRMERYIVEIKKHNLMSSKLILISMLTTPKNIESRE
jgi:hypothetical protein